jgi:hypothetical protein
MSTSSVNQTGVNPNISREWFFSEYTRIQNIGRKLVDILTLAKKLMKIISDLSEYNAR